MRVLWRADATAKEALRWRGELLRGDNLETSISTGSQFAHNWSVAVQGCREGENARFCHQQGQEAQQ